MKTMKNLFMLFLFISINLTVYSSLKTVDENLITSNTEEDIEKITFSWTVSSEMFFDIIVDGDFTVNWGDGNIEPYTDNDSIFKRLTHNYRGTYTVVITGMDGNCRFYLLDIEGRGLNSLDISEAQNLFYLKCGRNPNLANIDFSANTSLQKLFLQENGITNIDLSSNTELVEVNLYNNNLTEIDISANTQLEIFNCSSNNISELDLSSNLLLKQLSCGSNNLTVLDLSSNIYLTSIWCNDNQLTDLDISNKYNLDNMDCSSNLITNLNTIYNAYLKYLDCGHNPITSLNLNHNSRLEVLNCSNTDISTINLQSCRLLYSINVDSLDLETLDITNNAQLTSVSVINNRLTSLDLSNNRLLKNLYCNDNSITELDFSNNPQLYFLYCHNNQLTGLDLSANSGVFRLWCYNNSISLSDLYECSERVVSNSNLLLGTQNMEIQYVNIDSIIDLSGQMKLGPSQTPTQFVIQKDGSPAQNSDYILDYENETLVIRTQGSYTISMTNSAIYSYQTHPINVIYRYEVSDYDLNLIDLIVSEGTLTPAFNSGILEYSVNVANNIETVIITATPSDPDANVAGDGEKTLNVGANSYSIIVTSEDGNHTKTYTVTITREGEVQSDDATLSDLEVSEGTLNPVFNSGILEYSVNVSNNIETIIITATPSDPDANVAGDGEKTLNVGANSYGIIVTSEDGNHTKTYTITITRGAEVQSDDATLSDLAVSEGTLTPAFNSAILEYSVNVANNIETVIITATSSDPDANVAGDGGKTLNIGANPYDIIVTSEDGNHTKTYTVTITREGEVQSDDATLSDLEVSEGTLTPAFNSGILEYSVNVENNIETIIITATSSDPNATVTGDGEKTLNYGENDYDIIVTSQDLTNTKTYNVKIIRGNIGIDEFKVENSELTVYPNPANDILYLNLKNTQEKVLVEISNIKGIIYYKQILEGGNIYNLNISNFIEGIYFIKINNIVKKINIVK